MRERTPILTIPVAAVPTVAAGAAFAATNEETEKAIASALVDELGDDAKTIKVAFFDGKAVLSGKVTEDATQELAKEVALHVPGVTKVENEIEAAKEHKFGTGKVAAETEDSGLESDVKKALRDEIGTCFGDVEIETCNGVVSLRGTVPDKARHELAVTAAKKVKGVKKVVDLIRIAG